MDIKSLYENTELTIQNIADTLNLTYKRVFTYIKNNYSVEYRSKRKSLCYSRSKLGDKNPRFNKPAPHAKVVVSDNKGYWMTLKPKWYTGRKKSRHVFVHHIVVCLNLQLTQIPSGWTVHHCDFDTANNRFDNLVLMMASDHMKLHQSVLKGATTISKESTLKWVEAHGTPFKRDDIVSSALENAAAYSGQELTNPVEGK